MPLERSGGILAPFPACLEGRRFVAALEALEEGNPARAATLLRILLS
ncbi:hypothetical protein D187_002375 [Cystobacter fuscus DSM 2262]|uniref:Uncharacterized protein n=1 Tax=Cystobacter fuscus (strain ATCC 25194 / DSM 2262 / NBRC 100088 / M29) TaxID=1242864 RepID=S9QG57_CYSF2|nr:hypothetical protein D187_002375 [Cystobacter fuscus DSM 2262]